MNKKGISEHNSDVHPFSLENKVALVTGASGDIGQAIVVEMARAGADVVALGRNHKRLRETLRTATSYGVRCTSIKCDLRKSEQIHSSIQKALRIFGRIDILVNNAAIGSQGDIETITEKTWDNVLNTNLRSIFLISKALTPVLRKQRSGRIINIASISAQTGGTAGGVAYTASKGGILSFTKTLARDMAPFGVTVNAISPGVIDAGFGRLSSDKEKYTRMIPLERVGTAYDVAYAARFLASNEASYITGATLDVNGGLLKR